MSKATYVTAPSFLDRKNNKTKYLPVPSSLANYHCSVLTFPIRSEYQHTSAFDFFLLQNTVGIENVPLSKIALRYYRDSVTVILTASCLQTYVMSRAVTEQNVTQSCWLVEFTV